MRRMNEDDFVYEAEDTKVKDWGIICEETLERRGPEEPSEEEGVDDTYNHEGCFEGCFEGCWY